MQAENQPKTRRTVLAATGVAAVFGLAGCVSGDDEDDTGGTVSDTGDDGSDGGEAGGDERTVTLLVEGVGGHDDEEHDDGHDYGHEGLTSEELGHACEHLAEVEEFGAEDVEAGDSPDESPHLNEVHHPYSVTFEGESGYVLFELGDHDHDEEDSHEEDDNHDDEDDHDEEDDHGDEDDHHEEDEHHDESEEDDHDDEDSHDDTDGEMLAFFTQDGVASVVEGEAVYSETEDVESCDRIQRYVIVEAHDGSAVVELTAGP